MSNTITRAERSRSIKLEPVLSWVETNISKQYRLGTVGTRWLSVVEVQTLRGITFVEGLRRFQRPGLSSSTSVTVNLPNCSPYHGVEAFYLTGDIEKYGTGFKRIKTWLEEYPEIGF